MWLVGASHFVAVFPLSLLNVLVSCDGYLV